MKESLITIVGPTGTGKSEVAVKLAKKLDGEIVSADSMQIYKGMDIGTAKLSLKKREGVNHYLLDVVETSKNFSVAQYQKLARAAISEITKKGKSPFLVGGTGLYIRSVIDKFHFPIGTLNSSIRKELQERAQIEPESLYEELKKIDPETAAKIPSTNLRRIIRALEVIKTTGKPFSKFQKEWEKRESIYNLKIYGLEVPRDILYSRLNERVDKMIKSGLLVEVKTLLVRKRLSLTARQALGYKEIIAYLKGEVALEEAIETIKKRTRNFAKRQLTWFKRDYRIKWVNVNEKSPDEIAEEIINDLKRRGD
ncbi:MAG: tRNA (adenosine(37)-N6)-dimethylallyltransferase MiaA [Candidatus Subteraquimicrobiales bacterium]|nr:tRNA (adenosine(37)-N6)-dimethylallyltransferase MiaA [Candidatus Subteraquimicrobiales bacterium]